MWMREYTPRASQAMNTTVRVRLPPLPLMNRAKVRARLATVMMRLTMTPVVTALEV